MRILLTADPMLPVPPTGYGGIERIVDSLVREFRAAGHQVALMARADSTSPADVRFAWPGTRIGSVVDTVRNAFALKRAVCTFLPDVVHSFSRLAYLTPLLRSTLPKFMSYQRHTGGAQIRWAARLSRGSLQFTGCSEFIASMGRRAGGMWYSVPNFVEVERVPFTPRVPADAPLVFLSRIERIKGPDLAIAMARSTGRRLILAGNRTNHGPEEEFWSREIAPQLEPGRIDYIGEVNDAVKYALLGGAAALIVPVQWDEPFGIVFVEALAAGTPVISCRRGALPEIIEHGRTGFLVQSITDGSHAIRQLPSLDRTACREAASTRFDSRLCAARYLSLYRNAMPALHTTDPT